jgi:putative ABC transport system ATP-binding protein
MAWSRGDPPAVEAAGLTRVHRGAPALDGVSLTVASGEAVAVMGPSGAGKTTLLHLIGGLDRPDRGSVRVRGVDWRNLRGRDRARFRRRTCGFVLQGESLLPAATVAENIEVPLLLDGMRPGDRRERVAVLLDRLDLIEHAAKLAGELSGGQRQRVAIARAVACLPAVLLADEPTGSLDFATGETVMALMLELNREAGTTLVLVTHDAALAARCDQQLHIEAGRVSAGAPPGDPSLRSG